MIKVKKTKLKNNLRVVVVPMQSTEAVTVIVMVKAGSRYETIKNNGIAHFLEHMFFKGGDRYKTPRDVAEAVDGVGGQFNAWTSDEVVGYYIKVAKENIEVAFDVLSDMLLNSKFKQEDIEREQGVIVEEYNMYQDSPQSVVGVEFQKLMYGDHPLGRRILGDMDFIRSTNKKDFLDYRKNLYTSANMIVSVAGNTTLAEVKKLTGKYFLLDKSKKSNTPIPYKLPKKQQKQLKVINKKTEQAHLIVGVPAFGAQDPNKYIADILSVILGGGMSSRLFASIRERHGLAYYVRAAHDSYSDAGDFTVFAGVNINKADLAIKLIMDELKEIQHSPVPTKELKKAKQAIIGQLVLSLESSNAVANGVAVQELLFNKVETIAEIKKKYRAVTAEQIQKLAQKIFKDEKLVVAIIGPYKNDKFFKKVAKL